MTGILNSDMLPVDPDAAIGPEQLEFGTHLVLSNNHIREATSRQLDEWALVEQFRSPITVASSYYGWLVSTVAPAPGKNAELPDDLVAVLDFARNEGCTWLHLDRDGPETGMLPTFEW